MAIVHPQVLRRQASDLWAALDADVSWQDGINLKAGKNLVGAFWEHAAVFADLDFLANAAGRGPARRPGYGRGQGRRLGEVDARRLG